MEKPRVIITNEQAAARKACEALLYIVQRTEDTVLQKEYWDTVRKLANQFHIVVFGAFKLEDEIGTQMPNDALGNNSSSSTSDYLGALAEVVNFCEKRSSYGDVPIETLAYKFAQNVIEIITGKRTGKKDN